MPKSGAHSVHLHRPLRFGIGFRWCVVQVSADGEDHTILIAFHAMKRNFHALLFSHRGSDSLLLARLENHGTHPGTHLHACCKDVDRTAFCRTSYPELLRIPEAHSPHRKDDFPAGDDDALELVGLHFNISSLRKRETQLSLKL